MSTQKYKYRLRTIADNYQGLEKAVVTELVRAGDELNKVKKSIPPEEQELIKLLFSGEHHSQALIDMLSKFPADGPGPLRMYASDKVIQRIPKFANSDVLVQPQETPLSRWKVKRALMVKLIQVDLSFAATMLRDNNFDSIPSILRLNFLRLGSLQADPDQIIEALNEGYEYGARSASKHVQAAIEVASRSLQEVLDKIPQEELEESHKLWTGQARGAESFMKTMPIDGQSNGQVVFTGEYTEALKGIRLKTIQISSESLPPDVPTDAPISSLTHWQIKRAWHHHLATVSLAGANDSLKRNDLGNAIHFLTRSLKLIGAAGVPSFDQVEQAALSRNGTAAAGARNALNAQVRDFAITQYEKERDAYRSPREAAGLLAQDVLNYAAEIGAQSHRNFKDTFQVRDTVYKWLLAYNKNASAS